MHSHIAVLVLGPCYIGIEATSATATKSGRAKSLPVGPR